MIIKHLDTDTQTITVEFQYGEIQNISNGLYLAKESIARDIDGDLADLILPEQLDDIQGKAALLFDLIKHGMIQKETVNRLQKAWNGKENSCESYLQQ